MPLYMRKSVRAGPVRFNLSKRGVGASVGVTGARVGYRADGRPSRAGGRGGLSYRHSFGRRLGTRLAPATMATLAAPVGVPVGVPVGALTGRTVQVMHARGALPSTWRGWVLADLSVAYVGCLVLAFAPSQWVWGLLLLNVALIAEDAGAYFTAGHLLPQRDAHPGPVLRVWLGVLVVLLACLVFVLPAVVLWQAIGERRQALRAAVAARGVQIAQMERELGLPPS